MRRTFCDLGIDTPVEVKRDVVAALIPAGRPGFGVVISPNGGIEICGGLQTDPQEPDSTVSKVSNFR